MLANASSSIVIDGRWDQSDGIGRFSREVLRRLPECDRLRSPLRPLHPLDCLYLSGVDMAGSWLRGEPRDQRCLFSPGFNAPLWGRRPFVFTIHDLIHLECPAESSPLKSLYYRYVVKRAAERAFRVLTVSEYSKQQIVAWSGLQPEQVVVAYNGVQREFCVDGPRHRPGYDYLLYVGNHKPHKNVDRLLAAFAPLAAGTSLRLVMTGDPSVNTRSTIARLGIHGQVEFTGLISDDRLAQYYRGARLLVLPSLIEGFGLPVVEAMACGTPVVCANAGSLPEIVGDAACLVDPLSVADITQGLARVLRDDGLEERLRQRGLERARRFNWDTTAAIVWNVLQAAVATIPCAIAPRPAPVTT